MGVCFKSFFYFCAYEEVDVANKDSLRLIVINNQESPKNK